MSSSKKNILEVWRLFFGGQELNGANDGKGLIVSFPEVEKQTSTKTLYSLGGFFFGFRRLRLRGRRSFCLGIVMALYIKKCQRWEQRVKEMPQQHPYLVKHLCLVFAQSNRRRLASVLRQSMSWYDTWHCFGSVEFFWKEFEGLDCFWNMFSRIWSLTSMN